MMRDDTQDLACPRCGMPAETQPACWDCGSGTPPLVVGGQGRDAPALLDSTAAIKLVVLGAFALGALLVAGHAWGWWKS